MGRRASMGMVSAVVALGLAGACGGSVVESTTASASGSASGSGSGGSASGGGGGGGSTSSSVGAGGSASCPPQKPEESSSCPVGDHCFYGDTQCQCYASFGGWTCRACPPTEPPKDATLCMPHQANCAYGATQCTCFGGGPWNCNQCPPTLPQGDCNGPPTGLACDYGPTHCECFGGVWSCS